MKLFVGPKSAFLSSLVILVVGATSRGATSLVTVDDSATTGWTYSGFTSYADPNGYGGTLHGTSSRGSTASYAFEGSTISVYSWRGPDGGSMKVYVDNVLKTTVSLYNATDLYRQQLYSITNLSAGPHTLKLQSKGGGWGAVDYLQVAGTGTTVTPTPTPSPASTSGAPAAAVAAGYTKLTFDDEFTSASTIAPTGSTVAGYNWYPNMVTTAGYTVTGGILTIKNDITGYGGALGTAASFQHGYFEASLRFNPTLYSGSGGWPAFWAWPVEADTAGVGVPFDELDFAEAYPAGNQQIGLINTLHQWTYTSSGASTQIANPNNYPGLPSSTDYTQFHTYGCLWTPGKVVWYFDNVPVTTVLTGPGTPFTALDQDHLQLILGTGLNWPMDVDYVHVYQAP